MAATAKVLLLAAAVLAVAGLVLLALSRFGVGRLPLDFRFERGPVTVYLPVGTAILLSLVATLLLNLYLRLRR